MKKITKSKIISGIINKKPLGIRNYTYFFLNIKSKIYCPTEKSPFGSIQDYFKSYPVIYKILVLLFSPYFPTPIYIKSRNNFFRSFSNNDIILNIGSGPEYSNNHPNFINIDISPYDGVDIVTDASTLPIKNSSVNGIISIALLEHVIYPRKVINEAYRVLKPGGRFFFYVPFIAAYHAAPYDYFRWTAKGLSEEFSAFKKKKVGIGSGPTSGMLWIVEEWLAIAFSFGNTSLHDVLLIIFMIILSPLKLLDLVLWKLPNADKISSCFFITGVK